ncbi:MAG: glycosyltransferase family 4 protein [Thermoflexales bacterium]|nr:glycosyltransferase family 4 protein [Thermoflexales bacterium]
MHIVMIGPFAFKPKGTVSARAFYAARALTKRGHTVTILMPPYDNPPDSGRCWTQDGVRLENIKLSPPPLSPLSAAWRMARRALALKADVIHVFKPIAYSGLAAQMLSWQGVPWALDHDDWEGRGGWADINPYPTPWKHLFYWQESWAIRHARAVTVASRTLQTQVWGMGVDSSRVFYVPNGPDEALRKSQIASRKSQIATAIYLGHIPHGNDLDQAIEAVARLQPEIPHLRLVIAGIGDGLPALQALVKQRKMDAVVSFPGWIDPPNVPEMLAGASVAVYPYRDTLVNRAKCSAKLIGYMAAGLPIIASRVGQNAEYIEHGASGWLVEPGDIDGLVAALRTLLADPTRAQELGSAARKRLWERFDWDVLVERFLEAYKLGGA